METLNLVDSMKDRLSDGDYLSLMNSLKRDYDARLLQPAPTPPSFETLPPMSPFYANPTYLDKDVSTKRGKKWFVGKTGHNGSSYTITWMNGHTTVHNLRSLSSLIINHNRRIKKDVLFRELLQQL